MAGIQAVDVRPRKRPIREQMRPTDTGMCLHTRLLWTTNGGSSSVQSFFFFFPMLTLGCVCTLGNARQRMAGIQAVDILL